MVQYLTRQGKNDLVVAEEDLYDRESFAANQELFRQLVDGDKSAPTLALNAVGGQSASLLLKLLAPGGTMVTYGGMSAQPVTVHTPQLIFQDLQLRGYWHSRWMARASLETKTKLCNDLVDLVLDQGLTCPPVKVFRLQDYKQALEFNSQQSEAPIRTKVVFDCQE